MAKILVTGANGFLGSWLVAELSKQGHQVKALVRAGSDLSELEGVACEHVHGDVTNKNSLDFSGIDAVFHLAGLIAYKKSERKKMELVNVVGTQNVVDACRQYKVPRLVHISSVVAVGAGFDKNQILNEQSEYNIGHLNLGYFETKRQAELIVKNSKLDTVILNPSTIYGSGDARKGSRGTQLKVAQGKFPFYTPGGVNVVAVEDVISGIISAWKIGKTGERYILSSENITIKELFKMIAEEAGVKPPSVYLPKAVLHTLGFVGDLVGGFSRENAWTATLYHWFDSSKAQSQLDFKPRPARFAIGNSVKWMKDKGLLR
jgi:dihydroflavonol-4-reductase